MTVATTDSRKEYAGNGSTTSFDTSPMVFLASTDLVVYVTVNSTGVSTTLTESTDYTVTGGSGAVGTVSTLGLYGAPAAGTTLIISRDVPATQETDFVNNDASDAEVAETALDKLTMLIQQLKTSISRTFHLSDSAVAVTDYTLPTPEANSGLGWNSTGTTLINYAFEVGTALVDLAASTASALIGFIQSGTSAVARTVQDKLREAYPSVDDFGAVGDGATVDTAAFTAAQTAHTYVYVPRGKTYIVAAGLNYWQFFGEGTVHEPGITWDLSPFPQQDYAVLKMIKRYTWGNYEHAVGSTIGVGLSLTPVQSRSNTQVMGTSGTALQPLAERGSVALNISNYGFAQSSLTHTTYTATTVTDANATTGVAALAAAGKLKRGMIVDVTAAADRLSRTYTGTIQSWAGDVITVDAWYTDGSGSVATPSANAVATVNPLNKVWGININVKGQNDMVAASGIEVGLLSDNATQSGKMWGVDSVELSGYAVQANFIARGYSTHAFIAGTTWGTNDYGFTSENPQEVGMLVRRIDGQTSTGDSFAVETGKTLNSATGLYTTGGARKWTVDKDGLVGHDYRLIQLDTDTTAVSVGHVVQAAANTIIVTTTNRHLVMPTAVGITGRMYRFIAFAQHTVAGAGAETINGMAPAAAYIVPRGTTFAIISDGANWQLVTNSTATHKCHSGTTTSPYSVTDQDSFVAYTGAGSGSVILPDPGANLQRVITIKAYNAFTLSCITAGDLIEDASGAAAATYAVAAQKTITVISNGVMWNRMYTVA